MKSAPLSRVLAVLAALPASPLAAAEPAPLLSRTGLYSDIAAKRVDPANELFAPQYPLWSDGAVKTRWIRLPPGAPIDTTDMDRWVFPIGTKFWKEFAFRDEKGALHRVETRFMEKRGPDDWSFASYAWNVKETEAALAPEWGLDDIFPIGGGLKHDIPSVGECRLSRRPRGARLPARQLRPLPQFPGLGLPHRTIPAPPNRGSAARRRPADLPDRGRQEDRVFQNPGPGRDLPDQARRSERQRCLLPHGTAWGLPADAPRRDEEDGPRRAAPGAEMDREALVSS